MSEPKPAPSAGWFRFQPAHSIVAGGRDCPPRSAWTMHKARQQGIAVAALEGMGCKVSYQHHFTESSRNLLERLRRLLGEAKFSNVSVVDAVDSPINDALWRISRRFLSLKCSTSREPGSRRGLIHLEGLGQLWYLDLTGTHITDAGLAHLAGLGQLSYLNLSARQVTDAGLLRLRGLPVFRPSISVGTQVTDARTDHISRVWCSSKN